MEKQMKLYLNRTSPYARLTLVTVHETGLAEQVEKVWIEPWNDPPELLAVNPLARIPALVTDDGAALIESSCICDYLIARSQRDELLPAQPQARTNTLQRLGLGRAVIDCAFSAVIQRRFNKGSDTELSQRWLHALPRAAGALDRLSTERNGMQQPDLGDLAVAVAFDYVNFRLPEIAWRDKAPALAKLVDAISARPSMIATRPP
jgi:glutathione S-transferase